MDESKQNTITSEDYKEFLKSLEKKEYVKQNRPDHQYYILTYKERENSYKVFLLDKHKLVYEDNVCGLNESKYKAIEILQTIDASVFSSNSNKFIDYKVGMAHYWSGRKNNREPWDKDSPNKINEALEDYYKLRGRN